MSPDQRRATAGRRWLVRRIRRLPGRVWAWLRAAWHRFWTPTPTLLSIVEFRDGGPGFTYATVRVQMEGGVPADVEVFSYRGTYRWRQTERRVPRHIQKALAARLFGGP